MLQKVVLYSFLMINAVLCQVSTDPTTVLPTTDKPEPSTQTDAPTDPTTLPPSTNVPDTTTEELSTTDASSTTEPLPTTTEVPPEPTTTPAPAPEWKAGNWSVTDEDSNVTCIVAHMAVEFKVMYETGNGNLTAVLMVPPEAEAEGVCGSDNQTLTLRYPSGKGTNVVEFVFSSSGSASKNFIISSIELNYYIDSKNFPNASDLNPKTIKDPKVDLFMTQVGKSYKCQAKLDVNLNDEKTNANATMVMQEAQIEAFRTADDQKFGVAVLCSADEFTSDIVPIAVGCALAALVVIVIIAYLIGRRRARAKGYQSM